MLTISINKNSQHNGDLLFLATTPIKNRFLVNRGALDRASVAPLLKARRKVWFLR